MRGIGRAVRHATRWGGAGLILWMALAVGEREGHAEPRVRASLGGVWFLLELAETPAAQHRGLGGRLRLGPREGMLFLYPRKQLLRFWMREMRIPIDILWLDGETIVHIAHEVPPEPGVPDEALRVYRPPRPADSVIEIAAGQARALGLSVGQRVELRF